MTDPHGALLHLDYLAMKSDNHAWLLDVYNFFEAQKDEKSPWRQRMNVLALPGWTYSRALVMRIKEKSEKKEVMSQLAFYSQYC
jgi:mannosyltransferase OCH1-like enzyme